MLSCAIQSLYNVKIINFFEHPQLPIDGNSSMLVYYPVFSEGKPIGDVQDYLYNIIRQRLLNLEITRNLLTIRDDRRYSDFLSSPQTAGYITAYAQNLGAEYVFVPEVQEFTQGYLSETIITMRLYIMRTYDGIILWEITATVREKAKDRYDKPTVPVEDARKIFSNMINVSLNNRSVRGLRIE